MKHILSKNDKGIGLVEVLVSIGIVGSAMVIITSLTLSSLRLARKNEYQDVAVQSAVEALDFLKDPVEIDVDLFLSGTSSLYDSTPDAFYLDFGSSTTTPPMIVENSSSTPIGNTCTSSSPYVVAQLLNEGYLVCRQILILSDNGSKKNFYITVHVVWETIGDDFDKRTFEGYRYGALNVLP